MNGRSLRADRYMPVYDVYTRQQTHVAAAAGEAYAALRSIDISRSPVARALFAVRTLPSQLRGKASGAPQGPLLEQALALGWVILEERPGQELIAGAAGQPWASHARFRGIPADRFAAFSEPGFAKILWVIAAHPTGPASSILSTEIRVRATDPASRRKFRGYWLVFGSGIRLVRFLALRLIKTDLGRVTPRR